ncbi:MAG TPA: PQQ-dependent sugar dehydrogenase [Longimicrobiaceae bacterium]|nr:PQQ-dependent sugar dehydrogenase [Longimicrobiaceae bacterium]
MQRAKRLCAVAAGLLAAGSMGQVAAEGRAQQAGDRSYRVVTVAEGLEHPWGMAFLPGGDVLVTERPGRLRVVRGGVLAPEPIAGVPQVRAREQGGLMDVALHPDFARNRLVYLSYSKPGPRGATTAVARGRLEGNRLTGVQEILEAKAWSTGGDHFGSRLVFDGRGHLFVSVGERGRMRNAQDLGTHAGKILRLHDDGRVPADNPFVGCPGALPEIYAYGVRNPQGMALHPATGELWETEHGPRGGDELNRIRPGANYGWPLVTHGIDYSGRKVSERTEQPGVAAPLHAWVPSIGTSGLAIYDGDRFPGWKGDFFVGGLAGRHLARVRLDGARVVEQEKLLGGRGHRIRDVRVGPDGFLYVLVDAAKAPVLRLEPVR